MSHQYFLLLPPLAAVLSELTLSRPSTEQMISSTLSSFCHDSVSHRRHGGNACFSLRLEQTDYPEFGPFRAASAALAVTARCICATSSENPNRVSGKGRQRENKKMKALVFNGPRDIRFETYPDPSLKTENSVILNL